MSNKKVNITVTNLDITQLHKIRQYALSNASCDRGSVGGAYRYELKELVDAILDAGYSDVKEIKAPELTIY